MADLARLDENCQDQRFCELVKALKKWRKRNPKIVKTEKNAKQEILIS